MRVILEIISGATAGRKVRLAADQELRVGRTDWADLAVPQDRLMSGVHFALQADPSGCYLIDLGSSNGTQVNGQPVSARTRLRHGDGILAGETKFAVHIEQDAQSAPGDRDLGSLPPLAPSPRSAGDRAVAVRNVRFSVEPCSTGLLLCRGNATQLPPQDLAGLLAGHLPLYWIVDFRKLGLAPPVTGDDPSYLFSWLPPEAAGAVSPRILAAAETDEWPALVARGWGADALVGLFSRQSRTELVAHLQAAARVKSKKDAVSSGMLGFCWPSVMAMLLAYAQPALVQRLLAGIEAVLVELPDLPETWQLYGASGVVPWLEKIGLQPEGDAARETQG